MNNPRLWTAGVGLTVVAMILCCAGCSAEQGKARSLARADRFFEEGKYQEAVIEYIKVLRIDSEDPTAIRKLGFAYLKAEEFQKAYQVLGLAAEAQPEDVEVRLALGSLCLAAHLPEKARIEALAVLDLQSTNLPAALLLADASFSSNHIHEAAARLRANQSAFTNEPLFYVALGNLSLRLRDTEGAEKAYLHANALAPDMVQVHLALANMFVAKGDRENAGLEFAAAAELEPRNTDAIVRWAAFKLDSGDVAPAKDLLDAVLAKTPDHPGALFQLARVAMTEKDYDACVGHLGKILAKQPGNTQAVMLRANAQLAKGQPEAVIESHEKLVADSPNSAGLRGQLAVAYLLNRDVRRAIRELESAVAEDSCPLDSKLLLCELQVRTGKAAAALGPLEAIIRGAPGLSKPYLLVGLAYHAAGRFDDATAAFRKLIELVPLNPQAPYLLGRALLAAGKDAEATQAFGQALAIAPDFVPALAALVAGDLKARRTDAAVQRVEAQLALAPKQAAYKEMLAQIHLLAGDTKTAEKLFLEVIDMDPTRLSPYVQLCQVYADEGREEEALKKAQDSLAENPDNPTALMLAATLEQRLAHAQEAVELYEKLLKLKPGFTAAANNLAYLYSEELGKLEEAYKFAQLAHEAAPNDPYVADTLGWILYRRGEYKWALAILKDSAEQLPEQPEAQYHAGMTCYALGDEPSAIMYLDKSLALNAPFPGADNAREIVDILNMDTGAEDTTEALVRLQTILERDPQHIAALSKTAAIWARRGDAGKARDYFEKTVAANAAYVPAWEGLAEIYWKQLDDPKKALKFARKARELAPVDARVAALTGQIEYACGNFAAAAGLLRESAQAQGADPQISYVLGMANYMQGQTAGATQEVARALASGTDFPDAGDARLFLDAARLLAQKDAPSELPVAIEKKLQQDPGYIPGLMLRAKLQEAAGRRAEAQTSYEDIIRVSPTFGPAVARLAALYTMEDGEGANRYDFLLKARELLPRDPEVALAMGKVLYSRKDYDWARRLLEESAHALPDNPEPLFYIGMCYHKAGNPDEAAKALAKFVELDPDSALAKEARRVFESLK